MKYWRSIKINKNISVKKEIILDFGSGNTCNNDKGIIREMIDQLNYYDTRMHNVIIKWQLFLSAGDNIPLNRNLFLFALRYAEDKGYKTTASVFDYDSLEFLLGFKDEIPFIKIANSRNYYYLIGLIPRKIDIYCSVGENLDNNLRNMFILNRVEPFYCVSEYPANPQTYYKRFNKNIKNISDHTTNFDLYYYYDPKKIEWHYKLQNSKGLDSGEFARTPKQLSEVL